MVFQRFQTEVDRRLASSDTASAEAVAAEVKADIRDNLFGGRVSAVMVGSAPLSEELGEFIESCFELNLTDGYGSTEAGMVFRDGIVQRPPVIDYKLVDVPELGYFSTDKPHPRGELLLKTDGMFLGYYKRPEVTAGVFDADGFYMTGDIVAELFKPLPSMVVAHYLGVPQQDWAQFDGWTQAIVAANTAEGGIVGALETVGDAVGNMMAYFTALIERRRTEPEDDTISHLVAAGLGADGDISGILSILGFTFTMVTGGNDTVTGMLGGSMPLLHERPDQRQLLVDDPDLIPDAVEELLRLTSPVQGLARTVTSDVTIGNTTIPAGRRVLLLYGSANRDERQYGDNAGELDVTRRPRNILTFSHGAHHCLGSAAARMQSRVALGELLSRCPGFEVDAANVVWSGGHYVRRPLSVPIRVST